MRRHSDKCADSRASATNGTMRIQPHFLLTLPGEKAGAEATKFISVLPAYLTAVRREGVEMPL